MNGQSYVIDKVRKDIKKINTIEEIRMYLVNLTPMDKRISSRVISIVENKGGVAINPLEEADFSDDLGFDSLDKVELWMDIEKEFSIKIEEDSWEDLCTVNKLIKYIEDNV